MPPTFDGERKRGDDVEAWLLGMRKYFQLHNYSSNLEVMVSKYHLHGKVSLRWNKLKQVKHIDENKISWNNSRNISRRSIFNRTIMTRRCESSLNSICESRSWNNMKRSSWSC
jgi:hypothetical protein